MMILRPVVGVATLLAEHEISNVIQQRLASRPIRHVSGQVTTTRGVFLGVTVDRPTWPRSYFIGFSYVKSKMWKKAT